MSQNNHAHFPEDGNQGGNFQEPSSGKSLQPETQPKLKKIKTRTTIVEQREDEDLVYEKIKDSKFKQQRLPAWRPVPTIMSIIIVFTIFGIIFIILGIVLLVYSSKVHSVELNYTDCTPDGSICSKNIEIDKDIDKPVFIYYQLDGFFQNSRRYVKSKNIDQLRGKTKDTDDCEPAEKNKDMGFSSNMKALDGSTLNDNDNAIPCGLMAKTFFNDNYIFIINNNIIKVNDSDIAFDKDKDLYKKNIDISKQWIDLTNQHFIVWMRPSGLPNPRKLWGKIDMDLKKGDSVNVNITSNYNVSAYDGKKKIILSNATVFGGKNKFLGISYIIVGCLSLLCAVIFPIGYRFQLEKEKEL